MDKKTLETILYIVFILFLINCSTYFTNWLGRKFYEKEFRVNSVFDIFHEYTPDFHKFEPIVNVIPFGILVCLFFCGLPLDSIKEFAWKLLLIYVIRALTVITTILPKHERCNYNMDTFSLGTFLGGCYDKVFSGHMAFTFLGTLIYYREKFLSFPMFVFLNLIEATFIILTRAHYTIDVFLAILITYLVYDGDYHIFTDFAKKLKV
jgi:hypothetical protein